MRTPRRLSTLAAVALALGVVAGCVLIYISNTNRKPTEIKVPAKLSAPQSYSEAVKLLDNGKSTRLAIALLRHAVSLDPSNSHYHEALACAYTARAAFIYRAVNFRMTLASSRNEYPGDYVRWQLGQFDKSSAIYGVPKPVEQPYHEFRLKDDDTLLRSSNTQAESTIIALNRLAETQWKSALMTAHRSSDVAEIHFEHARGLAMFAILHSYDYDQSGLNSALSSLPTYAEALNEAVSAAKAAPDNAEYWQTAGDLADDNDLPGDPPPTVPSSRKYYLKSLNLYPQNEALWLRLADQDRSNYKATLGDLQKAVQANPNNAYTLMLCCNCIYKQTHYETGGANDPDPDPVKKWSDLSNAVDANDNKAVEKVRQLLTMAAASDFNVTVYGSPSVTILEPGTRAENTTGDFAGGWAQLRNCARNVASTAYVDGMNGHPEDGRKMLTDLASAVKPMYTPDHFTTEAVRSGKLIEGLVGEAIESIALKESSRICDKFCSKGEATRADKAYADFYTFTQQNRQTVHKLISPADNDIYYYY